MPHQLRVIAFDVGPESVFALREALPGCEIEAVNGATAASLTRDWDPGTVDLLVVEAHEELVETLTLCRFLVSSGVLARESLEATDTQEELPKTLGLHRSRQNRARRPPSPLLVLVPPGREGIGKAVLAAGARSCLMMPIHAKEVASILVRAQEGNQPGRYTLNLDKAQTEDRWRDDGGQG
jgi:hypothetical protein